MNDLFHEMVAMLQDARQVVRDDLERQSKSSGADPGDLTRLLQAIRNFAAQADSLLNMMIERDPLNPTIAEVADLLDFFQVAEMQVVALLETGA